MTSTDGVNYTFTKEGVTLSKGTIEYKVVVDHSWGTAYGKEGGNDNATYTISEDGVYDVVVSFNAETHVPSMEATKKGSATVEHTWSIIGKIFGADWNTDWDMTLGADGKYTYTATDVVLAQGNYEYKARADKKWELSYPSSNAVLSIPEDGTYDVTFTLDVANGTVDAVATKKGGAVIEATYTVAGTPDAIFGTVWDATNTANDMTESNGIYTFTKAGVELLAGDEISFKVVKNHSWDTSYGNAEGGNVYYKVNVTGSHDITITFDPTVGVPEITVTNDEEPVDGQELVNGDHKVVIKGIHYTNLDENNYVLTITSEETMDGLGGSFWHVNGEGTEQLSTKSALREDNKQIVVTTTSTSDPQLYTPLYVLMPGEINFGQPTIEWEEQQAEVTYQVTFVNEAGWEGNIYAYAWSGDDKVLGDWPGTQMENEGNNTFSITLPSAAEYIIFNNNGSQTANLAFENNKQYTNAEPTTVTYTVAGNNADIFGTAWDATNTDNDMTESDGIYTFTKTDIELAAGDEITFKVVKNHSWDTSYGDAEGNDVAYTVKLTGSHDITITFDPSVGVPEITVTNDEEPVDGQELVNGDHKVVIKGIHYTNLDENNYVLTITSEETMDGLGGSFWHVNGEGTEQLSTKSALREDNKQIVVTTTSTSDPQLYTPLYVLMPGEINFGQPTIEWEEQQAEVTYQVTFVNEAGWEGNIYAYAWSGDDKVLGDWPGTQMENEGNNTFSITLPSAAEYIIFTNNNGSQTADLAFVNNKQYTNAEEPADSYTVKFVNIAGWNDVYVYGWNGSTNSGWTANKAEKTSTVNVFGVDADVYECTISLSVEPKNLIFHNNNGTQTQDLQWVEGATYSYDDTEKGYFLFTDDADQFKPAENIDVAGAKASYARQFTPGNVCTVVLPFAIGADVAKAAGKFYRITSIADGYIRGTEETPAPYVPYIFIPAKDNPFTNIGIGQLPAVQNNSITTAEGYTLQFVTETTELASDASYDYYGFQGGNFVKAAYATVNPFRSYIKVAKSANAPATLIWTDDEATGISSLKADIQNGKADVYDLQGRRVLNPVRGLYIVNGKKVIVK